MTIRMTKTTLVRSGVECRAACPQGNGCVLDGATSHELHICQREECACHNAARYEAARFARLLRAVRAGGKEAAGCGLRAKRDAARSRTEQVY